MADYGEWNQKGSLKKIKKEISDLNKRLAVLNARKAEIEQAQRNASDKARTYITHRAFSERYLPSGRKRFQAIRRYPDVFDVAQIY